MADRVNYVSLKFINLNQTVGEGGQMAPPVGKLRFLRDRTSVGPQTSP